MTMADHLSHAPQQAASSDDAENGRMFTFTMSSSKPTRRVRCHRCGWTTQGNGRNVFSRADSHQCVRLTRQQETALRYLLREGEGGDHWLRGEGVSPCPTMDNLVGKGLVENITWEEHCWEERGWRRRLTAEGERVARGLAPA